MQIKQSGHSPSLLNIAKIFGLLVAVILIPVLIRNIAKDPTVKKMFLKTTVSEPSKALKTIVIAIKPEHYAKLKAKRDEALSNAGGNKDGGILISSDDDFVKASILYEDKKYNSEIRLKGDWTEHLLGETWSFRVKLKSDQTIEGMRKFSLQHPKTRNYAAEWLFHDLLKQSDIIHLRYDFVNLQLKITGELHDEVKELGVYAMEEFFDKNLIEHNKRRAGVLLKLDEDPLWRERRALMNQQIALQDIGYFDLSTFENLDIIPFGKNKVLEDSTLYKQFLTARYLFESFINQDLPISKVFDVEKLATYNAICNILGANHALIQHNYRVYYNPISSRLEPIGFDADAVKQVYFFQYYLYGLSDNTYSEAYLAAMEKVSSDDYFENFINSSSLRSVVDLLESAYPEYTFDEEALRSNKKVMRALLFPIKSLHVFLEDFEEQSVQLSISNFNRYPAEILGLSNTNNRSFASASERIIIAPDETRVVRFALNDHYRRLFIQKKKGKAPFDFIKSVENMQVDYKTLGTSQPLHCSILEWPKENISISETDLFRKKPNADQYDFLLVDKQAKTITGKPGSWILEDAMIIPPGYIFTLLAGTSIEFKSRDANILSFSPIHFLGTREKPVTIFSQTEGRGLLVLNVKDTSIVRHTRFDNLAASKTAGWAVSGAVNFYDAPVKFYNCAFLNNRSEDALNIISTSFDMDRVIFQNTQSDAFDGDFVEGSIRNTLFEDLGNDAIDVSGSNITVTNVQISNAGDKGLSAGEESIFIAKNITIKDSEIAVASKDKSLLQLSTSLLIDNQLSFTAFQKKSEFGSASIIADSINYEGNSLNYLIETGSSLELNGTEVETIDNVVDRMYGVEFGKKSK